VSESGGPLEVIQEEGRHRNSETQSLMESQTTLGNENATPKLDLSLLNATEDYRGSVNKDVKP